MSAVLAAGLALAVLGNLALWSRMRVHEECIRDLQRQVGAVAKHSEKVAELMIKHVVHAAKWPCVDEAGQLKGDL